jgi:hypothetical protein
MATTTRYFRKIDKKILGGEFIDIIPYEVGSNQLSIFFNGLLCIPGRDYQYMEVGKIGEKSEKIQIRFTMDEDDEFMAIVIV